MVVPLNRGTQSRPQNTLILFALRPLQDSRALGWGLEFGLRFRVGVRFWVKGLGFRVHGV